MTDIDGRRAAVPRRVLIVGAGIAGSTLAVTLHRLGNAPELVEIQPEWGPVGVGLTLMGPALRALGTLGLIDRAAQAGAGLYRFAVGNEATEVSDVANLPLLNGPGYPSCVQLSRPAFHQILADAVREAGVPVRVGTTVDSIEHHRGGGVEVTLSDGTHGVYDLVVGADGVHSRVRALAFPEIDAPHFTRQAVWRAMVDRPADLGSVFEEGTMYMFYGPDNKALVVPTSARQLYIAIVENVESRERPPTETLPAMMRAQLADFSGFMAVLRDLITTPSQVVWRVLEALLVPSPWYRDRVVLIGDAAHTTTPHLASGAGIAIEDAVVLGEELAEEGGVTDALDRFMGRRYERCRMVVENSVQLGEWEREHAVQADPVALTGASWALLAEPI